MVPPALARQPIKGAMTKPENRAGLGCGADNAAAVPALQRRARLAGFYDHYVALGAAQVLEWRLDGPARAIAIDARHVGVTGHHGYAIDAADRLWRWRLGTATAAPEAELDAVALASAGDSGVLAIRCDGSLWQRREAAAWQRIAPRAIHAWVGDSSDYFIDGDGRLFVAGKAHRGQYGTGQLTDAPGWVPSAEGARFVVAHTGHAVVLRDDGAVLGTGGNRYGPLATHGLGDKADRWGVIFTGAAQIASGSRHTLALRADGQLFGWGGADGTTPKPLMSGVTAMAAGLDGSAAIDVAGAVWRWRVGSPPQPLATPR
jgi:hypothetical protein